MFLALFQCLSATRASLSKHSNVLVFRPRNYFNLFHRGLPATRNIQSQLRFNMPPKRKRSSVAPASPLPSNGISPIPIRPPSSSSTSKYPQAKRQATRHGKVGMNPDRNTDVVDGKMELGAFPDAEDARVAFDVERALNGPPDTALKPNTTKHTAKDEESGSLQSDVSAETLISGPAKKNQKTPRKSSIAAKKGSDEIKVFKAEQASKKATQTNFKKEDADEWGESLDPNGDEAGPIEGVDDLKKEAERPPPVHSDYLPLPWKGRLGYVSSVFLRAGRLC